MEAVGCKEEIIYNEILNECKALCDDHYLDERPGFEGNTLCNAHFNAGSRTGLSVGLAILTLAGTLLINILW